MKRFTILFFALAMMNSHPVMSQISVQHQQFQGDETVSKQISLHTPIVPFKIQTFQSDNTNAFREKLAGNQDVSSRYFRSTTFDSTWAGRFQTVLDSLIGVSNVPGGSIAVLSPGQGMFYGVSGISSPGEPITPEMRFGIGSNTKLFICTVLLKLQEQGLLSLDDSLHHWLSPIQYIDGSVTIRQMLAHQSGFFDYFNDNASLITDSVWADTSRFWSVEEVLATIGPPHFSPGQGWSYSNTNYMLAGEVIEAVTGESWVDNLHEIIFDPLEMDSTFVGAYEPSNGPVANEWDSFTGQEIPNSPMTAQFSMMHAAGGILSAACEMTSWYASLLEGDILSTSSLQQLTDFEPLYYYGLGIWGSQYQENPAYLHTGGTLGYLSMMWYDVRTGTVLCILYNGREAVSAQFSALLDVLYGDFPKQQNDAGIAEILEPWSHACNDTIIPVVVLENFGTDSLTSVVISNFLDGELVSVQNWMGSLGPGDTAHLTLEEISAIEGYHNFTSFTSQPNGVDEGYTFNDTSASNFIANLPAIVAPMEESFEGDIFPPEGWCLKPNSLFDWTINKVASYSGSTSAIKNNYQEGNFGGHYDFDLPPIDLSTGNNPALYFQYAYARYPGNNYDSLKVFISGDCGDSWDVLFNKGGAWLATVAATYDPFWPVSGGQWKQESFALDDYQGEVLIRFRAISGSGNNLFLDDIAVVFTTGTEETQMASTYAVYPNPTSDILFVSGIPDNSEIFITDITGKLLRSITTSDTETMIDLRSFPKGIYILKTRYGSKKIVKI